MPDKNEEVAFPYKEYQGVPIIPLPEINLPGMPLGEAIQNRRSCRNYADAEIKLKGYEPLSGTIKDGLKIIDNKEFKRDTNKIHAYTVRAPFPNRCRKLRKANGRLLPPR